MVPQDQPRRTPPTLLSIASVVLCAALVAGCPDGVPASSLPGADAGADAGQDVAPDVPDLLVDSSLDGGRDAADAEPDLVPDSTPDAEPDTADVDADAGCTTDADCEATGFVCDDGTCRPAADCEERDCGPSVVCDASTTPPTCLEACEGGLRYEPVSGSCVADEPNCTPGAPGSLVETCTAANRACVETSPSASCGACLRGFVEDAAECRAVVTCAELECADLDRDCDPAGPNSDAACGDCSAGYLEDDGGTCVIDTSATCRNPDLDPFSIRDECEAQSRECVVLRDGAVCGGCVLDFAEDDAGECAPLDCDALYRERGEEKNECGDCLGVREEDADAACVCPAGLRDDPFTLGGCVAPDVCPFNYRDEACAVGCPLPFAHWGGTNDAVDPACDNGFCADDPETRLRDGVWICAQVAAAGFEGEGAPVFSGAGVSIELELDGEVPNVAASRTTPLCQDAEDCSRGYSVR